jgi:hypothetical protein
VHRAHEQAVLGDEKLAGSPIQAPSGVRADVEPDARTAAVTMHDQRFGHAIEHGFDFDGGAVVDCVKVGQQLSVVALRDLGIAV